MERKAKHILVFGEGTFAFIKCPCFMGAGLWLLGGVLRKNMKSTVWMDNIIAVPNHASLINYDST